LEKFLPKNENGNQKVASRCLRTNIMVMNEN
jgi:hypothetical protein